MKRRAIAAALALAACGQTPAENTPDQAMTAEEPSEAGLSAALRGQAGDYYNDFIRAPGMDRYAPAKLSLAGAGSALRLERTMQTTFPSVIIDGEDGTEALVFSGCMAHMCGGETAGVVAINVATGEAFVGVKDAEGESVLMSNARLETLLTQNSPTQNWTQPLPGDE